LKRLIIIFLLAFFFCHPDVVNAQELQLSDQASISLITILPGEAPEELFGHSAVRVNDPVNNIDISYNYGTFNFDTFFLVKFTYGDLEYFLSQTTFESSVNHYLERRRPMIEQVLNLSTAQRQQLFNFLRINAQEENRYYQYDFLFDNCSTRIRDALEQVFGENVQFSNESVSNLTFRDMIHQYVEHRSFIHLGIDLLLGADIDRLVTYREQMFLPDYLMREFDKATIQVGGERQPLVSTTEIILQIEDYEIEAGLPWASILTWSLLLIGIGITYRTIRDDKGIEPWFDLFLYSVTALIGLLITYLWFISLHNETVNNLNLLWAWPVHLILIPLVYRRTVSEFFVAVYLIVLTLCCLAILVGWNLWPQQFHAAIIPLLLLLIIRSGSISLSSFDVL